MGTATPGGALLTVSQTVVDLQPCAVIMVGVAFGIPDEKHPEKRKMGDILVAHH